MSASKTATSSGQSIRGQSNVANYEIAKETNQANQVIAQQSNEWNYRMFLEQQKYNKDMWAQEMAYNSPEAQAQRYRDAGFNPYLMDVGSGNVGSAQSVSPPTATAIPNQAPVMTNGDYMATIAGLGNVMQGIETAAKVDQIGAMTEQVKIDNVTRGSRALQELAQLREQTAGTKLSNQAQETFNAFQKKLLTLDVQGKGLDNDAKTLANDGIALENIRRTLENAALPEQLKNSISLGSAEIVGRVLSNQLTDKQIKHEVEKMIETQARAAGITLDNKVKSRQVDDLVKLVKAQADRAYYNASPDDPWKASYFNTTFGDKVYRGLKKLNDVISPFK